MGIQEGFNEGKSQIGQSQEATLTGEKTSPNASTLQERLYSVASKTRVSGSSLRAALVSSSV